MFKALFANDQALSTVFTIVLVNTSLYTTSNLILYYFTYIIGDGNDAYSLFSAFGGAAQILAMVLITIFLSDSVDYGEVKNGTRDESVIFSMQTFVVKLASGFAVWLAGVSIDFIGLNVEAGVKQTEEVVLGMNLIMTILPVIGLVVAIVYWLKKYKLDDETLGRISRELKERKNDSSVA